MIEVMKFVRWLEGHNYRRSDDNKELLIEVNGQWENALGEYLKANPESQSCQFCRYGKATGDYIECENLVGCYCGMTLAKIDVCKYFEWR